MTRITLVWLHRRIQDVFNRHNLQIVSPQYCYMMDPGNPEVVAKDRWYSILVRPPKG